MGGGGGGVYIRHRQLTTKKRLSCGTTKSSGHQSHGRPGVTFLPHPSTLDRANTSCLQRYCL